MVGLEVEVPQMEAEMAAEMEAEMAAGGTMPPPPSDALNITPGVFSTSDITVTMGESLTGATIYYRLASDTTTDLSVPIDPDDMSTYTGTGTSVSLTSLGLGDVYRIKAMAVLADGTRTSETAIQRFGYDIDSDDDGLIEIRNLEMFDNIRNNLAGTGYAGIAEPAGGCPAAGCIGYELMVNLDFDVDGDGSSWTRAPDGTLTLDEGDDVDAYFDIATGGASGGWVPIGNCGADNVCGGTGAADDVPFTAVFEGNDNTISNLATMRDIQFVGLFGAIGGDAEIRRLGLVDNLAKKIGSGGNSRVGTLAGTLEGGTIVASHSTGGRAEGSDGAQESVGGLVGRQQAGSTIAASYATGNVDSLGGISDSVGGLVGIMSNNSTTIVIASYATATVAGSHNNSYVGGLVGQTPNGTSITASYATGAVTAGSIGGGLVGAQFSGSSITASYATGDATGSGSGSLIGAGSTVSINASWGFGTVTGVGSDGSALTDHRHQA